MANSASRNTVPTSGYVTVEIYNEGISITAIPSGGGTVTVQFSTSPYPAIRDGSATWQNWAGGAVAAITTDTPKGKITGVRATAAVATGTLEVVQ